jgi:uncharacterized protein (TIGR00251 family)
MAGLPLRPAEGGVVVALRVTPNAARDTIEGIETRPGAGPQLRIRVRAVPDKGKANRAVIALLAEAWDLPPGTLTIVTGETARDKVMHVAGPPDRLIPALTNWFEAHRS